MNDLSTIEDVRRYRPLASIESAEIAEAMTEPVGETQMLETLVRELKRAGIWGRLGEITWARDSRDGLLLQWTPAH